MLRGVERRGGVVVLRDDARECRLRPKQPPQGAQEAGARACAGVLGEARRKGCGRSGGGSLGCAMGVVGVVVVVVVGALARPRAPRGHCDTAQQRFDVPGLVHLLAILAADAREAPQQREVGTPAPCIDGFWVPSMGSVAAGVVGAEGLHRLLGGVRDQRVHDALAHDANEMNTAGMETSGWSERFAMGIIGPSM